MAESNSWNNGLNQGQNRGFSGNGSTSGTSGAAIRDAIFDRVPPHDDAAEMAVLGGMLMSKDAIGEVSQMIDITDFYQPRNQTVYEAIINLFSASQPVDAVLVAVRHQRRRVAADCGGDGPERRILRVRVCSCRGARSLARPAADGLHVVQNVHLLQSGLFKGPIIAAAP